MSAAINEKIEPKTEQSLPSKTEPTDDEPTMPLHDDEIQCQSNYEPVSNGEQSSVNECNKTNDSNKKHSIKDTILTSSQYLTTQSAVSSIGESNIIYFNYQVIIFQQA